MIAALGADYGGRMLVKTDMKSGEELPTNVGFGRGDDANLLWVTSGKSVYKIRVGKKGYQLP
jgi:hypothetical protein